MVSSGYSRLSLSASFSAWAVSPAPCSYPRHRPPPGEPGPSCRIRPPAGPLSPARAPQPLSHYCASPSPPLVGYSHGPWPVDHSEPQYRTGLTTSSLPLLACPLPTRPAPAWRLYRPGENRGNTWPDEHRGCPAYESAPPEMRPWPHRADL